MKRLCKVYLSFLATFFMPFHFSGGLITNPQVSTLLSIRHPLSGDPKVLASWSLFHSVCKWKGILWAYDGLPLNCSIPNVRQSRLLAYSQKISVMGIDLEGVGLQGTLPSELASLSDLQKLNLSNNSLTGNIPLELGNMSKLSSLVLRNNELSGSIPVSIWNLCGNVMELVLSFNHLSGKIPEPQKSSFMNSCSTIKTIAINNNSLSGTIPDFLAHFTSLQDLDLSGNFLQGHIPSGLASLRNLSHLNLSHNNLSGQIPRFSQNFGNDSFVANSQSLCGHPLSEHCNESLSSATSEVATRDLPSSQLNLFTSHSLRTHSNGVIAGIIIGSIAAVVVVGSLLIRCYDKSNRTHSENSSSSSTVTKKEKEEERGCESGKLIHFQGGENLTVEEVLNATGEVLGKSACGSVYKAKLSGGGMIALRLLRDGSLENTEKFMPVILELGKIRHRNLAPIRAFYSGTKGEKLLAYDYFPRGNLSELLHSMNRQSPGWARRHKIALGAARALAYLHTGLNTSIIHGNIKSKNILLDENCEAHLSDFGLHRLMSKTASVEMLDAAAAQGYKAPELTKLRRANAKSDVYSFGIVLLEILTGRRPGRCSGSSGCIVDLPSIVKEAVLEERVSELFDLELLRGMSNPADEGLVQALQVAMGCCAPSPVARPHIKEVVSQLEEIKPKSLSPLSALSPQYNSDDKSSVELIM